MLKPKSFKEIDRGPWILTYSGIRFYPYDPSPDEVNVQDIAHALSHQCRFVGHTRKFYSVAEHSVRVSDLCSKENKLWGILHDAAEAYISDISGPLKSKLPEYKAVEKKIQAVIMRKFNLPIEMPQEVKDADLTMLVTEGHWLMPRPELWIGDYSQEPLMQKILPMNSEKIKQVFMEETNMLIKKNSYDVV